MLPVAWPVSCVYWQSFVLIVCVPCLFVFRGSARFLELSLCNTGWDAHSIQ